MTEVSKVSVEVAFALPDRQLIMTVEVAPEVSLYDAVLESGILAKFSEIDLDACSLGVFGKTERNPRDVKVKEGDRIEIYRPLIADPKEVRKMRAAKLKEKQAAEKKGGDQAD
ncbi:MAG: RnfH family protein [Gammaproteobacteria bacterium]|nr:MAG: RnfH family protein [Gammaproteobacteria bacterium]